VFGQLRDAFGDRARELLHFRVFDVAQHLAVAHRAGVVDGDVIEQLPHPLRLRIRVRAEAAEREDGRQDRGQQPATRKRGTSPGHGCSRVNAEPGFYVKREWIAFAPGPGVPGGRYHAGTMDARIDQ